MVSVNGISNGIGKHSKLLWTHPNPDSTRMTEFMRKVNGKYGLHLKTYEDLYRWSIDSLSEFWSEVWDFTGVTVSKPFDEVSGIYIYASRDWPLTPLLQALPAGAPLFPHPDFFSGARLNFAENLLYPANLTIDEDSPAIIEAAESKYTSITWAQLRERVRICAFALRFHGVVESDRVAGFLGNHANAVVAMLAAASIGAIWTGVSPDTGVTAVLERLVQIEPKVLFVDNAVGYNGKAHGSYQKVQEILQGLKGLKACVMFETVKGFEMKTEGLEVAGGKTWTYQDFVSRCVALSVLSHMITSFFQISIGTDGPI
jgi:acetoacetyl-CoA synthetase